MVYKSGQIFLPFCQGSRVWRTDGQTEFSSVYRVCIPCSAVKIKIKAITAFKVIQVGTNRKPVCDFLLVIHSWHPTISYSFGVIAAYCSNFGHCVFERPFGGLGTTYDVHLGLIRKRSRLPINVNWTFSVGVTAESLRAKRSKIGDFAPMQSLWSKISGRGGRLPLIIFARIVRPINTLQLCRWQFSHKETL